MIVREPVGEDLVFVRVARANYRKQPGIQIGQGIYVFSVDVLDPLAILLRMSTVANADEQLRCFLEATKHSPDERQWPPARACDQLSNRLRLGGRGSRSSGRRSGVGNRCGSLGLAAAGTQHKRSDKSA